MMKFSQIPLTIVLSIFLLGLCLSLPSFAFTEYLEGWSNEVNGLQCRVTALDVPSGIRERITVRIEFKNVSDNVLTILDFKDDTHRGMAFGFNAEPGHHHLRTSDIVRFVKLEPGSIYSIRHRLNPYYSDQARRLKKIKMVYDTKIVQTYDDWWKESGYWKGRLEAPEIKIQIQEEK